MTLSTPTSHVRYGQVEVKGKKRSISDLITWWNYAECCRNVTRSLQQRPGCVARFVVPAARRWQTSNRVSIWEDNFMPGLRLIDVRTAVVDRNERTTPGWAGAHPGGAGADRAHPTSCSDAR